MTEQLTPAPQAFIRGQRFLCGQRQILAPQAFIRGQRFLRGQRQIIARSGCATLSTLPKVQAV
eukprot:10710694-Heterocapsa_arctica.AAC.1